MKSAATHHRQPGEEQRMTWLIPMRCTSCLRSRYAHQGLVERDQLSVEGLCAPCRLASLSPKARAVAAAQFVRAVPFLAEGDDSGDAAANSSTRRARIRSHAFPDPAVASISPGAAAVPSVRLGCLPVGGTYRCRRDSITARRTNMMRSPYRAPCGGYPFARRPCLAHRRVRRS